MNAVFQSPIFKELTRRAVIAWYNSGYTTQEIIITGYLARWRSRIPRVELIGQPILNYRLCPSVVLFIYVYCKILSKLHISRRPPILYLIGEKFRLKEPLATHCSFSYILLACSNGVGHRPKQRAQNYGIGSPIAKFCHRSVTLTALATWPNGSQRETPTTKLCPTILSLPRHGFAHFLNFPSQMSIHPHRRASKYSVQMYYRVFELSSA